MNDVNLYQLAEQLAVGLNSLYRGIRHDRARLSEFMETNDWFGLTPKMWDKEPYITNGESVEIRKSLELWLSAFKQPDNVKLDLLLSRFEPVYPQTCRLFREFTFANGVRGNAYSWKLLDFIFANIGKEITAYDESEIESFIQLLDSESPLASARLFADFLRYIELSEWDYRFGPRGKLDTENGAYPLRDYAVMAYCVFNEEMWKEQDLIKKATQSSQYADLWLHTAMHFVCALRGTDLARLPAPQLPYDSKRIIEDIVSGIFPEHFAAALTDELTFRLEMKSAKPSKTEKYQNIPTVKVFIPESLRAPLGIIIALALAHHSDIKPGEHFIFSRDYRLLYKQFFSAEFIAAVGRRQLSIRRFNKSYLQGIDMVTSLSNEPGRPKGYILAALARSHKSGIGTLPEITEIYLKDATFTGYSPEFIAREMFERGVFSFIPAALLEVYAGPEYKKLSVTGQTKLICEMGLTAYQIENIAEITERAMIRSRNSVTEVIKNPANMKESVHVMLQNIASGAAPGRQYGFLCLMTAAERTCPYPERGGCIGCGYEIHTQTTMHTFMKEYIRLAGHIRNGNTIDAHRYSQIIKQAIMPAVKEMLAAAKHLYPDKDNSGLLDIVEVEMNGVNCGTGRNRQRLQPCDDDTQV
jgi:hypothetical protein